MPRRNSHQVVSAQTTAPAGDPRGDGPGRLPARSRGAAGGGAARRIAELEAELGRSRRAEAELRSALGEVQDSLDHAACGFHSVDARGVLEAMNETELRWLGYTRDEVVGRMRVEAILSPADRERFPADFATLRETGRIQDVEREFVRKDGTTLPVLVSATAVRGPDGRFLRTRTTVWDLSRRRRTEEALRESERFVRHVAETTPDLVYVFDLEKGRNVFANREVTRALGYAPEQVAAMGTSVFASLLHPDDLSLLAARLARFEAVRDEEVVETEYRMRHAGGAWRWLHSRDVVFARGPDGRPTQILGIATDVTGQREAEEGLRQRERFNERMLRVNPDALYVFDLAERRVVFANRDLAELAGYSKEEVVGLRDDFLARLLHPDDLALYPQRIARFDTASDDDVTETLFRVRHRDGGWRWLHGRGVVFERGADGRPARVLSVVKDVTAEKEARDALLESERFHRTLAETLPIGIAVTGRDDRISWTSPAFRRLLGLPADEELSGSTLARWAGPGFEAALEERRRAPRSSAGLQRPREIRLRRRDGTTFWAAVVSAPLLDGEERFRGAIVAVEDVSDRKTASERLQFLSQRIVDVQEEERRQVARELHDEVGQALAAVLYRLEAARRTPGLREPPGLEEAIEITARTMQAVRSLSLDLHPAILDESGLDEALRWYVDRQVHGHGLAVKLEVDAAAARVPPAQRTACFRLAQEALTNVLKHSRARSARVTVTAWPGTLELVVADDGEGFDVADAFRRIRSGLSLGLLGMQERTELLGGGIDFESAPGRGTTVTAWLPLSLDGAEEAG